MRFWRSQSQHPTPPVHRSPRRVIGRVTVNVSGDADGRVAEHVGDRLDMRPAFEPAHRRAVPKNVDADALDPGRSASTVTRSATYIGITLTYHATTLFQPQCVRSRLNLSIVVDHQTRQHLSSLFR